METPAASDAAALAEQQRRMEERFVSMVKVVLTARKLRSDNEPAQVAPRVFVGSVGAAYNRERLLELGITHVLCVAVDLPHPHPTDFRYLTVPVLDSPEVDLRQHFDTAFAFMDDALQSGQGGVLVHCFAGRSRSVTVAIGYLMRTHQMSLPAAMDAVLAVRPIAQPNSGFMQLLARFEAEEEARRGGRVHKTRASTRLTCALT